MFTTCTIRDTKYAKGVHLPRLQGLVLFSVLPPPTLCSVCMIKLHDAANLPRHKKMVIIPQDTSNCNTPTFLRYHEVYACMRHWFICGPEGRGTAQVLLRWWCDYTSEIIAGVNKGDVKEFKTEPEHQSCRVIRYPPSLLEGHHLHHVQLVWFLHGSKKILNSL